MALTIKALKAGVRTTNGTEEYTVPANKSAVVYNIRVVNGSTTNSVTLNFYAVAPGQAAFRIYKSNHSLAAKGLVVVGDPVTLEAGGKIQINVNGTSPSVSYMINGVERDV
ncbi:MAG: hypothetical protein HYY24_15195 [Verrucomicrobia bacterium]|nr:hypothetical protein [Verrucomicrobiota bacterium]